MKSQTGRFNLAVKAFLVAITTGVTLHSLANTEKQKTPDYVAPSKELIKKVKPALVNVVVKQHDVPIATASGFFVSNTGLIATSHHIIHTLLINPQTTAQIVMADKKPISEFKIAACGDDRGLEICLLKAEIKPKAFLSVDAAAPAPQTGASLIAQRGSSEYSILRGEFYRSVKSQSGIKEIEIKSSARFDGEGNPIVSDAGKVIGIAIKSRTRSIETSSAISASELEPLLTSEKSARTLTELRQVKKNTTRIEYQAKATREMEPALAFALRAKTVTEMKGFKDSNFRFDEKMLSLTLPDDFVCAEPKLARSATVHSCATLDERAIFTIQKFPKQGFEKLTEKNGQKLVPAKPFDFIEDQKANGQWALYEKLLSPKERLNLASSPQPAQCQNTRKTNLEKAAFSEVPTCRFVVQNDSDPGAASVNVWMLQDNSLYAITIWMNDSQMLDYYSRVPVLAILTARWSQDLRALASFSSSSVAAPSFKFNWPVNLTFKSSSLLGKTKQTDLYGKKMVSNRFDDTFVLAVHSENKSYLPPDFDDAAKEAFKFNAKNLNVTIQTRTQEMEIVSVDDRAARVVTAFGTDSKGRDVLVFAASIYYEDATIEITQVSTFKDPAESFKEFRGTLSKFKRNAD